MTDRSRFLPDRLYADPETTRKRITVHFEATPSDALPWTFAPVTRSVKVLPGETALAFYTAKNNSDKDLIGIATYNMTPEKVSPFFRGRADDRSHLTLPRLNAFVSRNKRSELGKRLICRSFSSLIEISTMNRVWMAWTMWC